MIAHNHHSRISHTWYSSTDNLMAKQVREDDGEVFLNFNCEYQFINSILDLE